ncbi:DsbA family oxidoreductase [uncultured Microbulbifer sp.]|uniref:DsbA family oxidoreductase n=1 Tax=uncultured Microbulbifer sp. TaxID=348147 RepID=UPI0025EE8383|nr:DsbA family oxidoreductase [uncultured Microbulbifer sp.]
MNTLRIEVAFDFICPWCLIGKRNLARALALFAQEFPRTPVSVQWQGVQLLPELPAAGVPFAEFYRYRLGSDEAVRQRQAQVTAAAASAGVVLDLKNIQRMPNTANAHRLFQRASLLLEPAQAENLLERMFAAYFKNGEDLGDGDTLLAIAASCGLDAAVISVCLDSTETRFYAPLVVAGVPNFTVNGRVQLTGAQPPEQIFDALCQQRESVPA